MITLITGDNTFEITRQLAQIEAKEGIAAERIDASLLDIKQLPDLLMGGTLFADKRLVVMKNMSDNKALWPVFYEWLPRISDDINVVLVEPKPDKRTVTYKELKKLATVIECTLWTERDTAYAEKWVIEQAAANAMTLGRKEVALLVRRVGVDQWQLADALEKLQLAGAHDQATIEQVIDAHPSENVFNLFDAALRGDRAKVVSMLGTLQLTDDPYRLFGLLAGQAFQVAAVAVADQQAPIAADFGVHPYAVSKLKDGTKRLGKSGAKKVIAAFATADDDIKLSRADPWLLIERALLQVASI